MCRWVGLTLVLSWSIICYLLVVYEIYGYIMHPGGDNVNESWNAWRTLPNTCCEDYKRIPIYLHILGSILILMLGPIQFLNHVKIFREKCILLHKISGITYVMGCTLASLNGLVFIYFSGSVGGIIMDLAFGLAGLLTFVFPLIMSYYAITRNLRLHREWALRTYVIASSSVFYRVLYFGVYNLIYTITRDNTLHTNNFQGPIDFLFDFLYYLLPILFIEIYMYVERRMGEKSMLDGKPLEIIYI